MLTGVVCMLFNEHNITIAYTNYQDHIPTIRTPNYKFRIIPNIRNNSNYEY